MSDVNKVKTEIRTLLGNKCSNPYNLKDCSTKDFIGGRLVPNKKYSFKIDHINGFGNRDRYKCMNKNGNINYYKYYKIILEQIRNGSKDYQLLCCVCDKFKTGLEAKEMRDFYENVCPQRCRFVTSKECEKCEQKENCRWRNF